MLLSLVKVRIADGQGHESILSNVKFFLKQHVVGVSLLSKLVYYAVVAVVLDEIVWQWLLILLLV